MSETPKQFMAGINADEALRLITKSEHEHQVHSALPLPDDHPEVHGDDLARTHPELSVLVERLTERVCSVFDMQEHLAGFDPSAPYDPARDLRVEHLLNSHDLGLYAQGMFAGAVMMARAILLSAEARDQSDK